MLSEFIVLTCCSLVGSILLTIRAPGLSHFAAAITVAPVGILFLVGIVGLVSLASLRLTGAIHLLILCCSILVVLSYFLARSWSSETCRTFVAYNLCGAVPVILAVGCTAWWDPSFILGDTMIQAVLGLELVLDGWDSENAITSLTNWSFTYVVIQLMASAFGRVYFATLAPLLTIISLMAFIYGIRAVCRVTRNSERLSIQIAVQLISLLLLTSCFYFVLVATFVTSNVLLLAFSTLFVATLFASQVGLESKDASAVLLSFWLTGIALSRTEGVIYASFFAVWLFSLRSFTTGDLIQIMKWPIFGILSIAICLEFASLSGPAEHRMLTSTQVIFLFGTFGLWLPFLVFFAGLIGAELKSSASNILAIVMLLVTLSLIALSDPIITRSAGALGTNILKPGLWASLPYLLLTSVATLLWVSRNESVNAGLSTAITLWCSVLLLSLGRTPYGVDIADSGHRLIGSLGPAILLIAIGGIVQVLVGDKNCKAPAAL